MTNSMIIPKPDITDGELFPEELLCPVSRDFFPLLPGFFRLFDVRYVDSARGSSRFVAFRPGGYFQKISHRLIKLHSARNRPTRRMELTTWTFSHA